MNIGSKCRWTGTMKSSERLYPHVAKSEVALLFNISPLWSNVIGRYKGHGDLNLV